MAEVLYWLNQPDIKEVPDFSVLAPVPPAPNPEEVPDSSVPVSVPEEVPDCWTTAPPPSVEMEELDWDPLGISLMIASINPFGGSSSQHGRSQLVPCLLVSQRGREHLRVLPTQPPSSPCLGLVVACGSSSSYLLVACDSLSYSLTVACGSTWDGLSGGCSPNSDALLVTCSSPSSDSSVACAFAGCDYTFTCGGFCSLLIFSGVPFTSLLISSSSPSAFLLAPFGVPSGSCFIVAKGQLRSRGRQLPLWLLPCARQGSLRIPCFPPLFASLPLGVVPPVSGLPVFPPHPFASPLFPPSPFGPVVSLISSLWSL